MENKELDFETKIEKAKEILQKLSQNDITLQESVQAYEAGIKELQEAAKMLEEAKLKITQIQQQ